MNDELEQQLDTLVRDACSVVPVPKSEYRRRLEAYGQQAARAALEELKYTLIQDERGVMLEADIVAGKIDAALKELG